METSYLPDLLPTGGKVRFWVGGGDSLWLVYHHQAEWGVFLCQVHPLVVCKFCSRKEGFLLIRVV